MSIRFSERFVLETNGSNKVSVLGDLYEALRTMTNDQSFLLPTKFNANSAQTAISIAGNALNKKFVRYNEGYDVKAGASRYRVFRVK